MLTGPLPELIDHRKLANQEMVLEGSVPVRRFSRLGEMLTADDGDVHLKLEFTRGSPDRTDVNGSVQCNVGLVCQACLTSYEQPLDCEIRLSIVADEATLEALETEETCAADGFLNPDKLVSLVELVEDELILAVPMIPRHGEGDCPENEYRQTDEPAPVSSEGQETHRPFAGLAEAMKNTEQD